MSVLRMESVNAHILCVVTFNWIENVKIFNINSRDKVKMCHFALSAAAPALPRCLIFCFVYPISPNGGNRTEAQLLTMQVKFILPSLFTFA